MEKLHRAILDKVLFVGPDMSGNGGMASVLASYNDSMEPFHYIATNSRRGTLAGMAAWGLALLSLPYHRLRGRRILHIHYAGGKSLIRKRSFLAWGRLLGFRTIMHCHCNISRVIINEGVEKMKHILGRADCNIVLAERYATEMRNSLGISPDIVNNPVLPMPEARKATASKPVVFLFLGLLNEAKGFYNLLEALSILKTRGLDFRLIIGGAGDVDAMNAAAERLDITDRLDFRGWMSGPDKEAAMAEADVIVLPSLSEGMPVCLLEAIASDKAAVASDVGAVPQLIDDGRTGYIVPPGDVGRLTEALAAYAGDPTLAHSHGAAAAGKLNDFLPQTISDSLCNIYMRILQ